MWQVERFKLAVFFPGFSQPVNALVCPTSVAWGDVHIGIVVEERGQRSGQSTFQASC